MIQTRILLLFSLFTMITLNCGRKSTINQQAVFVSGSDGYHTFRIPAITVTKQGTILAFCEGRKNERSDTGDIDLLLKRSEDAGNTWSEQQVVWDDSGNVCGNPCPVVDQETGIIWLLLTWNRGDDKESEIISKESKDTRRVYATFSNNDGKSWATPVEITKNTKDPSWGWYATGPGHGMQIKHGPHKSRLLIPCDHSYDDPNGKVHNGPFEYGSHIIYSDDHGETWKLGGIIRPKVNECQVVELADGKGTLLLNMRSYFNRNRRTHAISHDGGMTWSDPVDVPELIEPVCQAGIIRFSTTEKHDKNRILFSNPASKKREMLTIKISCDEGQTWPNGKLINTGPSAYSDLAVSSDMDIYCLYERGQEHPYETITCAKFNLDWLTEGEDIPAGSE